MAEIVGEEDDIDIKYTAALRELATAVETREFISKKTF
jgi:hypothetical protein